MYYGVYNACYCNFWGDDMRLIIGGNTSGKLARVFEIGYNLEDIFDCTKQDMKKKIECKVLYKLNHLVDYLMKQSIEPKAFIRDLIAESNIEVIVCDEVGCGVVPMERYEREFRECVGRICCEIAKEATVVERVYCGIATVIKSDEN